MVVLMHGLGDSAAGWVDVAAGPLASALPHALFILPTARSQPVSINGGMLMNSWYDIKSLTAHRELETCEGIDASVSAVRALAASARAAHALPASRTVWAGFSQGAAMALFTALSEDEAPAAVVAMSGYLPLPGRLAAPAPAVLSAPFFLAHGDEDGVVPLHYGSDARDRIRGLGAARVVWKVYAGMGHGVNEDELDDVAAFLKQALPEVK